MPLSSHHKTSKQPNSFYYFCLGIVTVLECLKQAEKPNFFLQDRRLWFGVMFPCEVDAPEPGSCSRLSVGSALILVSLSSCRRLWGSVALAHHTAMDHRLFGSSVAISRLQGLCCKAVNSALLNPYVSKLRNLC